MRNKCQKRCLFFFAAEGGKVPDSREKQFNRDSVRASVASAFGSYSENVRKSAFEHPEEFKKAREAEEEVEIQGRDINSFPINHIIIFLNFS